MINKSLIIIWSLLCTSAFGQNSVENCRYPFDDTVSADALVKFVIRDIYRCDRTKAEARFNSSDFQRHFYNSTLEINYDSVFQVCIQYLKEKLGEKLLCENVNMYINGFYVSKDKRDFHLGFGFTYPVLKRDKPVRVGTFTSHHEMTNFTFKYSKSYRGKVYIQYPSNIPECNGKADCGITITKEKATKLLNDWGLIKENDKVSLSVDGMQWSVMLTEDGWAFRHLNINIRTGEFSNFRRSHRID